MFVSAVTLSCGASGPKKPPGTPPTPATVTRDEPGGDAADPQLAAMLRLGREPWGWRNDKRDFVRFPLSDWQNWRRVRFWGAPTFLGFRYGDKHRAVAAMWMRRLRPGDTEDPGSCFRYLEEWAQPLVDTYGAVIKVVSEVPKTWRTSNDVLVRRMDVEVAGLISSKAYRTAAAATVPWPHVCAVYGYAFYAEDDEQAASAARDRHAEEAFTRLELMKPAPPEDLESR